MRLTLLLDPLPRISAVGEVVAAGPSPRRLPAMN